MLPFLNARKVPKLRTLAGESKYGFSEDDELCEELVNELIQAFEQEDHKKLVESLNALVELIRNKDASDAQQDTESI